MRVRFKANEIIKVYNNPGLDISLNDGQTADLPKDTASGLVNDFPQNFSFVKEERETPAVNRAITSSKSGGRFLRKNKK